MQTKVSRLTSPASRMQTKGSRLATLESPDTWPIKTSRALLPNLRADRKVSKPRVRVAKLAPRNKVAKIAHVASPLRRGQPDLDAGSDAIRVCVFRHCLVEYQGRASARTCWHLLGHADDIVERGSVVGHAARQPTIFLQELEQTIVGAFLEAIPNSYGQILFAPVADNLNSHVSRVEEYIDSHWHTAIYIESLVKVAGVGSRSLFTAFKRRRGYTPMAYLKRVRLKNSRALLASPTATTSVTLVALQCGFSNFGLSRDYQLAFRELPSATLAKARR
jgi:AraC-like DNA-binding protein